MERVRVDRAPGVAKQVHAELEVVRLVDVAGHDVDVAAVEQHVEEQPQRLPLRHVVLRHQQLRAALDEGVESFLEKLRHHLLVRHEEGAEGREGVGGDVELCELHVPEHLLEALVVQQRPRQLLMARALAEHQAAARCRRVADLVPMHELAEDVDVLCQVRDRKPVLDVARLLEQEAEQVCHVLARLKRQHRDPPHQIPHQPALGHLDRELLSEGLDIVLLFLPLLELLLELAEDLCDVRVLVLQLCFPIFRILGIVQNDANSTLCG
mmetsp:Transcript_8770/g.20703  ORF Transcript_8770/g.20703 Transcript_8770/m.20703 type:complete len:267 (-) Transcript_8770:522-1322(-)